MSGVFGTLKFLFMMRSGLSGGWMVPICEDFCIECLTSSLISPENFGNISLWGMIEVLMTSGLRYVMDFELLVGGGFPQV